MRFTNASRCVYSALALFDGAREPPTPFCLLSPPARASLTCPTLPRPPPQSTGSGIPDVSGDSLDSPTSVARPLASSLPSAGLSQGGEAAQRLQLQRELARVHLVYRGLLSSMDSEIQRCYDLLQGVGLDVEGNPLPADEAAEELAPTWGH